MITWYCGTFCLIIFIVWFFYTTWEMQSLLDTFDCLDTVLSRKNFLPWDWRSVSEDDCGQIYMRNNFRTWILFVIWFCSINFQDILVTVFFCKMTNLIFWFEIFLLKTTNFFKSKRLGERVVEHFWGWFVVNFFRLVTCSINFCEMFWLYFVTRDDKWSFFCDTYVCLK